MDRLMLHTAPLHGVSHQIAAHRPLRVDQAQRQHDFETLYANRAAQADSRLTARQSLCAVCWQPVPKPSISNMLLDLSRRHAPFEATPVREFWDRVWKTNLALLYARLVYRNSSSLLLEGDRLTLGGE